MSDTEIAKSLKLSTTQFRVQIAIANEERRSANVATARRLRDEGNSLNEIAKKMGISRSYVSRLEKRALNALRKRYGE